MLHNAHVKTYERDKYEVFIDGVGVGVVKVFCHNCLQRITYAEFQLNNSLCNKCKIETKK